MIEKSPLEVKIDTTNRERSQVQLLKGGRVVAQKETGGDVLAALSSLLSKEGFSASDIRKVSANQGPGSFTGIRIGLSIANALKYALHLRGTFLKPRYGKAPNITKPKR